MTLLEAMQVRHSVRSYLDQPIPTTVLAALLTEIEACNRESGLHMQLITDDPDAFRGMLAHYGSFSGVQNYLAFVGKPTRDFAERCGYYGERFVLRAQQLGLNTCWVALTYSKGNAKRRLVIEDGEKPGIVISVGYGATQGREGRRCKTAEQVTKNAETAPDWFHRGVAAALLAPTAMNQQKFTFTWDGKAAHCRAGLGPHSKIDLGIVKYHFELGSGHSVE